MNSIGEVQKLGNGLECLTCRRKDTGEIHKIPVPFLPRSEILKQFVERILHSLWRPQHPSSLYQLYERHLNLLNKHEVPHIPTTLETDKKIKFSDAEEEFYSLFVLTSEFIEDFDKQAFKYSDLRDNPDLIRQLADFATKSWEMHQKDKASLDLVGTPSAVGGFTSLTRRKIQKLIIKVFPALSASAPTDIVLNNLYKKQSEPDEEVRLLLLDIGLLDSGDYINAPTIVTLLTHFTVGSTIELTLLANEKNPNHPLSPDKIAQLEEIRSQITLPVKLGIKILKATFKTELSEILEQEK